MRPLALAMFPETKLLRVRMQVGSQYYLNCRDAAIKCTEFCAARRAIKIKSSRSKAVDHHCFVNRASIVYQLTWAARCVTIAVYLETGMYPSIKNPLRDHSVVLTVLLALACAVAPGLSAQTYPSRPIVMLVPQAPGGTNDIVGRIVSQKLGEVLNEIGRAHV